MLCIGTIKIAMGDLTSLMYGLCLTEKRRYNHRKHTKYIRQYVKRFSNLNLKAQSLILIANCIIAFSCFPINERSFFLNHCLRAATWPE